MRTRLRLGRGATFTILWLTAGRQQVVEACSQLMQTQTHAAFDRAERGPGALRNLLMRESAEVGELDCLALVRRQGRERVPYALGFDGCRDGVERLFSGCCEAKCDVVEGGVLQGAGVTAAPAVDGAVADDRQQPRAGRATARIEGIDPSPDGQERLLDDVRRGAVLTEHAVGDGDGNARVPVVELAECAAIAAGDAC